jgi:hypothetical protein
MTNEFAKYDEFTKRMEEKYPKMFSEPYGGFCVGEGWWPILQALCSNIQHYLNWKNRQSEVVPQVVVAQIKEKFGGLRFYYDGGDEHVRGMVSMAESWASKTCETCGTPGKSREGGWIKTLCDYHETERQQRLANRNIDTNTIT